MHDVRYERHEYDVLELGERVAHDWWNETGQPHFYSYLRMILAWGRPMRC